MTSALEWSIRYGSALSDFESSVERLALSAEMRCEGKIGPQWTIKLVGPDGWYWVGTASTSERALVKANKAIAAYEATLAERGCR